MASQKTLHDQEKTAGLSRLTRCTIAGTALGAVGYVGGSLFAGSFKPKPINIISGLGGALGGTLVGDLNLSSPTYEERADYALAKEGKHVSDVNYRHDKQRHVDQLKQQDQMAAWMLWNNVFTHY